MDLLGLYFWYLWDPCALWEGFWVFRSLAFLVSGVKGSLVHWVSGGKGSLELNGLAMLLVSGAFGLQGCSCVVSLWACLVSSFESY